MDLCEFEVSQGYIVRHILRKINKKEFLAGRCEGSDGRRGGGRKGGKGERRMGGR